MDTNTSITLLAVILHESGRQPVAAGQTLAHAVQSPQVRPFVEWQSLGLEVQAGRRLTARRLLERYYVDWAITTRHGVSVDELAAAIHECEREAIELGLVLVKLNRPWAAFSDLPEQAQDGRRAQARYLMSRAWWFPRRR